MAIFDFSAFTVKFDRAIALSVFTHLTWNLVRVCLERLHPAMMPNGEFYATFFDAGDSDTGVPVSHQPGGIVTYGDRDPYHYRPSDLRYAADGLPWEMTHIGGFNHPRDQRMVVFRKK